MRWKASAKDMAIRTFSDDDTSTKSTLRTRFHLTIYQLTQPFELDFTWRYINQLHCSNSFSPDETSTNSTLRTHFQMTKVQAWLSLSYDPHLYSSKTYHIISSGAAECVDYRTITAIRSTNYKLQASSEVQVDTDWFGRELFLSIIRIPVLLFVSVFSSYLSSHDISRSLYIFVAASLFSAFPPPSLSFPPLTDF
jgi:hypothetical protein